MNTIKMLGFAAVTMVSLGIGAAMAQEGPNATVSGSAYFGNQTPSGMLQSGSADSEMRPSSNSHYFWTPGVPVTNAGSEG